MKTLTHIIPTQKLFSFLSTYEKYLHDWILVLNDLSPPWMSEALTDYIIIYALKKKKTTKNNALDS